MMRIQGWPAMLGIALALAGSGKAMKRASGDPSVPPETGKVAPATGPASAAPMAPAADTDRWIGKWVGVEGLALAIAPGPASGSYALTLSLMDGTRRFEGHAAPGGIAFDRDGKPALVHRATGAETGLKWLADKRDCLMIETGEGFCRD